MPIFGDQAACGCGDRNPKGIPALRQRSEQSLKNHFYP